MAIQPAGAVGLDGVPPGGFCHVTEWFRMVIGPLAVTPPTCNKAGSRLTRFPCTWKLESNWYPWLIQGGTRRPVRSSHGHKRSEKTLDPATVRSYHGRYVASMIERLRLARA